MMECLMLGIDPTIPEETTGLRRNLFIEDAQEYLDMLNVEYATEVDYKNRLNCHWLPQFAERYTDSISHKEIQLYLNSLSVSEKTKVNLLIPLKGVFNHAEIHPNPASKVKLRKHQKKKVERFLPHERDLILGKLSGDTLLYFSIAFGLGLRPCGELLGLRWDDYDGESFYVHQSVVRRRLKSSTKTSVSRTVLVPEWVKPTIETFRRKSGLVFQNENGEHHKDGDRFNEAWRAVFNDVTVKSLGINYRVPYTCRHTRAAELLSQGVTPALAAKQMGHSVQIFLTVYSEFIEEYARADEMDRIKGKPIK